MSLLSDLLKSQAPDGEQQPADESADETNRAAAPLSAAMGMEGNDDSDTGSPAPSNVLPLMSAKTASYRLNIDGRAQLVWLAPDLEPDEALRQAQALYPDLDVTNNPPVHGWPKLSDIPEIPSSGTPQLVECWTPSGKRLVVTAYSEEHAEQVRRMNPPRGDSNGDREGYEERVAIMEHDGGLPRAQAERKAATCRYCKHWCGTRSGSGWCVLTRPPVARQAAESCEQFTLEGTSC